MISKDLFERTLVQNNLISPQAKDVYKKYNQLFWVRRLAETMLAGVFIYMGTHFLLLSHYQLLIWPATGVALTIAFLRGNYTYLGMFIGCLAAFYISSQNFFFSVLQAIGFTAYIYTTRQILLHWAGAIQPLCHKSVLLKLFFVVSLTTCLHALYNHLLIVHFQLAWVYQFEDLYRHWLAELNSILCLTPLCLMLDPFTIKDYFKLSKKNRNWQLLIICAVAMQAATIALDSNMLLIIILTILLIFICNFSYCYSRVPTGCLLLTLGFVYLADFLKYSKNLLAHPAISGSFLLLCSVSTLLIALKSPKLKQDFFGS